MTGNRRTAMPSALLFFLIATSFAGLTPAADAQSLPRLEAGQSLGHALGLSAATNLRDLGGYTTSDGKTVARRLVYRSDVFHPLGIEPGNPFMPDDRMRRILTDAATTGAAMVSSMAFANRFEKSRVWPDRMWERSILTTTAGFETPQRIELDERAQGWYQLVGNGVFPYVAKLEPGQGQWYASTFRDKQSEFLDGSKTYKLTLQADPPAKLF